MNIFRTTNSSKRIIKEGAKNRQLTGKTVVFTGTLCKPRKTCAEAAANAGLNVWDKVNRSVDILVVGIPPKTHLRDNKPTAKQKRAQEIINEGGQIEILSESDFFRLLAVAY